MPGYLPDHLAAGLDVHHAASHLLPEPAPRKIRPPRALSVPYPLGYPLGEPGNRGLQTEILLAMLEMLTRTDLPALEKWPPAGAPRSSTD